MKRSVWPIALAFAVSCSGRDQTLGETHPAPHPIVIPDPTPTPNPNPNPNPNPDPNPDPDPDPNPNPSPTIPPCEDISKHARLGECVPAGECHGRPLIAAGYECEGDAICCEDGVGCSQFGCSTGGGANGGSGGTSMAQGGDATAGVGGQP
jgi:hypothetical protein